jgi:glucose-1-phosphatase
MTAYKALVFDLGKVVFDLSFDRVFHAWATAANAPHDALQSTFRFDALFDQFERNEITPAAFRAAVCARLGVTLTDPQFDQGWSALYLDVYPGVEALLARLHQRYRLVALTNTNALHHRVWPAKYAAVLRHFERVFCSHELGARKPEAEAYRPVLDHLQVAPHQIVFLDDSSNNVRGAEHLGLHGIVVTSCAQMSAALRALGVVG